MWRDALSHGKAWDISSRDMVQYIFANVPSSLSRARPDFLPTMLAVGEAQYGSVFGRMSMSQLLGALGKM